MSDLFGRHWARDLRHPSDEVLVSYLDGELPARKQKQIGAHLESCWSCRRRCDKFGQTIDSIMDYVSSPVVVQPPPRGWRGFEFRLRQLAAQKPRRFPWWMLPRVPLRYAGAALAAVTALVWIYLSASRPMSAMDLLNRAEGAETARFERAGTSCQKLRVRKTRLRSRGESSGTLESWREAKACGVRAPAAPEVWDDLRKVLEANRMDAGQPLSVRGYRAWRDSLPRRSEEVTRTTLPDGSAAFTLATLPSPPFQSDQILEGRLVVRALDWRAVEQRLEVEAAGERVLYEVTETGFEVQPGTMTAAARPAALPTPAPPAETPRFGDLETLEVETRYALHHVGACLGEPVEVSRDARGGFRVQGLADTPERKAELLAALSRMRGVAIEIRTPEEALAGQAAGERGTLARSAAAGGLPPLQKEMEEYFRSRGEASDLAGRISAFTNEAVSLAQSLSAHGWALQRLTRAYPAKRREALNPAAARLLEEMLRDHTLALRSKAGQCRRYLDPFLSGLGGSEAARPGTADEAAIEAAELILRLFSATNEGESVGDGPRRLLAALAEIENVQLSSEAR